MPPLREIRADLPLIATYFLRKYSTEMARDVETISPEAMRALTAYDWPGNVRELENEVKRAVVLTARERVELDDLSESIRQERLVSTESVGAKPLDGKQNSIKNRVTTLEIQMIRDAMTQVNGDKRRAAKMLGLSHQGLLNKLKRYGLSQ
jgi:DNA-binding NtrC family response regulator